MLVLASLALAREQTPSRRPVITGRIPTPPPLPTIINLRLQSPPPRVLGSVFGSISVQVGGLLILTTGSAPCTLMQHTPPLNPPPHGGAFRSVLGAFGHQMCLLLCFVFTQSSLETAPPPQEHT